jgi:HK97 family phage major capsid protein
MGARAPERMVTGTQPATPAGPHSVRAQVIPMTKKKVTLDVFEEAVLPTLERKHKNDAAKVQAEIDEKYFIYELSEDGKEMKVKFTVQAPPANVDENGTEISEEDRITKAVAKAIGDLQAKNPNLRNPLGADGQQEKKFSIPAELKNVRAQNFKGEREGKSAEERAFRFGMWVVAAKGSNVAREWCERQGIGLGEKKFSDELLQKLHSEGVNSAGGFLVPEEFGTDLIDLKETYGVIRRLVKTIPMISDTRTDPRRTGGLTAYPVGEGAAGTESTASWDQVRLTAKDWMVLTRMTNQVNADAVISMADKLAYEIAYAHTLKEDQTGFLGNAGATYSGITGLATQLTNKWGVGGSTGLIKQATGTTWGAIVLTDFQNVVGTLPQYADTPNACWVAHRSFYYGVMQKLELAAGGVTASEIATGTRRPRPLFLGYPVEFAQVLPGTTASAQVSAIFGDLSLGASFGDRQQDMISFSSEASVGGQSMWERNETGVRGIARWDFNAHDVGDGTNAGPICGLITG